MRLGIVIATALLLLAVPRRLAAEGEHDLVVIIHPRNQAKISAASLEAMFLRKERRWPDATAVLPLNLVPDNDARQRFDRAALGMEPDDVARYWLEQRIRDGTMAPREIADPVLVVKLVAHLDGAIGYVPASTDLQGVVIVGTIRQGRVSVR
jgi:hypothetical protein